MGLEAALDDVVPNAEHRFCAHHLYSNFRKLHKGKALKDKLWETAKATTVQEFGEVMQELQEMDNEAFNWVAYKHLGSGQGHIILPCQSLTSQLTICVSFNSHMMKARDKRIRTMLEMIRCFLMKTPQSKRGNMMSRPDPTRPIIHWVPPIIQVPRDRSETQNDHKYKIKNLLI